MVDPFHTKHEYPSFLNSSLDIGNTHAKLAQEKKEAEMLDIENHNILWMDAILHEIKNLRIAFGKNDGDLNELIGYQ